jgi:multimeric flavodoxin WrbA
MRLSIINGSPRGKKSNSRILTDRFREGFCSVESHCDIEEYFIRSKADPVNLIEVLEHSDLAIIIFPLYTDAMPGIVKRFFEEFQGYTFQNTNLKLGFIVQSGFPEAHHSRFIQHYLDKLAKRIGMEYLGTIIKGGVEGIKAQPGWMTKRYLQLFYDLGQHLALDWEFSDDIARRLARPEHLSTFTLALYRFFQKTRMATYYWDQQLKQNHAYHNRFAKPYSKP